MDDPNHHWSKHWSKHWDKDETKKTIKHLLSAAKPRIWPDDTICKMTLSTTSHLVLVCGGCSIALRVWKWPIYVGADSTEGHCIKAMLSFSMGEVLQPRPWPDDVGFGVAASTTTYLLVVCASLSPQLISDSLFSSSKLLLIWCVDCNCFVEATFWNILWYSLVVAWIIILWRQLHILLHVL